MDKPTPNQKKTYRLVVKHIVDSLYRASGDDENLDVMNDTFANAKHPIDTGSLDVTGLMADPKVKRAFKRFIADTVGNFQFEEENGEGY